MFLFGRKHAPPKLCKVNGLGEKTLGDTDREYHEFLREQPEPNSLISKSYSKHIIVLGAGISGLQTALSLRTTKELHDIGVHIIADRFPGSKSVEYASHRAGGHWCSHEATGSEDERIRAFEKRTYEYWDTMWRLREKQSKLNDGLRPEEWPAAERWCGIGRKTARYYWGKDPAESIKRDGSGLWWKDVVSNFRTLNLDIERDRWTRERWEGNSGSEIPERIPDGATMGIEYSTYCFDPTRYLQGRLKLARDQFGVTIIKKKIPRAPGSQLSFVVEEAKKILLNKLNKYSEVIKGGLGVGTSKVIKRVASVLFHGHQVTTHSDRPLDEAESSLLTIEAESITSPKIFREEDIVAFINCAGNHAQHFVGAVEANRLHPIRRQIVIVEGVATCCRTYVDLPELRDDEMIYIVPRPGTKTTVLGGHLRDGSSSFSPKDRFRLQNKIIDLVQKYRLAEELCHWPDKCFHVNNRSAIDPDDPDWNSCELIPRATFGVCLDRKGGPRVELESGNGGKIGGTWVLHNYGHGDGGFRSSVGCAEEIARLVKGLLLNDGIIGDSGTPRSSESSESMEEPSGIPDRRELGDMMERRIPMDGSVTPVAPRDP